jgi:hypothetical protein
VAEFAQVREAHHVWEHALNQISPVSSSPKRIVELRREYAGFFKPYDHIRPITDEFEPG